LFSILLIPFSILIPLLPLILVFIGIVLLVKHSN
jgi:hypothetical protein